MLNRLTCIVLTIPVIFSFVSCSGISGEEVAFYKQLDSTLVNSCGSIQGSIGASMKKLEAQTMDPNIEASEKAGKWYAIAQAVSKISNETYNYIDKLINDLINSKKFNNKTTNAVKELFTEKVNTDLHQAIIKFRNELLKANPDITSTFSISLPLNELTDTRIENISGIAAVAKLHKLQTDIRLSEQMLVKFCDAKAIYNFCGYDKYSLLGYLNSDKFFPGERAEISAGIGSYSSYAVAEISIDGHKAERTPNGDYQYIFKVSDKPGNYNTVITINYKDPNTGQPSTVSKRIRYKVLPECPADQ